MSHLKNSSSEGVIHRHLRCCCTVQVVTGYCIALYWTGLRCAVGTGDNTMASMLNRADETKDAQEKNAVLDSAQELKAAGNKAFAAGDLDQALAVSDFVYNIQCTGSICPLHGARVLCS